MNQFEHYAFPIIERVSNYSLRRDETDEEYIRDGRPAPLRSEGLVTRVAPDDTRVPDFIEDKPFDEETMKIIDGMIEQKGMELLVNYKSPHLINNLNFSGKWGVFIFTWSIKYIADKIRVFHPNPWDKLVMQAYRFLCGHAHFHWYVDAWTIDKELLLNTPLYEDYLRSVYRPHFPAGCYEEALANHHARICMRREGILTFLDSFMARQPAMYSQYGRNKDELRAHLAGQIIDRPTGKEALTHQRPELAPWLATSCPPILKADNCPIYLIKEQGPLINLV